MCENPEKFATSSYEQVFCTWTILIRPAGVPMLHLPFLGPWGRNRLLYASGYQPRSFSQGYSSAWTCHVLPSRRFCSTILLVLFCSSLSASHSTLSSCFYPPLLGNVLSSHLFHEFSFQGFALISRFALKVSVQYTEYILLAFTSLLSSVQLV